MSAFLIDGLGWSILHFLWQGTLICAGAALVLASMRDARPGHRYAVACIALLACLVWPVADLIGRSVAALSDMADIAIAQSMRGNPRRHQENVAADVVGAYMGYLVAAWAIGVLLLTLRAGAGMAWIARSATAPRAYHWERRAAQLGAQMGIDRVVRVCVIDGIDSPVTALWRRPLVLLPAPLVAAMPHAQLDALLAHELAHIRRHDYLANLVQTSIATLLFFHPAVWWLSRRINAERELLADAVAGHVLGEPRALARALAELVRHQHGAIHLAQAASGGELLTRVRALLTPQSSALRLRRVVPAMAVALAGVALAAHAADNASKQQLTRSALFDFDHCAKPVWPAAALAAGLTGTVTLRFQTDRDGAVIDKALLRSSGHPSLDQAALVGIGQCRFKPAQLDGMPVVSTTRLQYVWLLE